MPWFRKNAPCNSTILKWVWPDDWSASPRVKAYGAEKLSAFAFDTSESPQSYILQPLRLPLAGAR